MNISSPDLYNSKSNKDFVDIDLIEDMNCGVMGEYAHSIFAYLREAEVRFYICHTNSALWHIIMVHFYVFLIIFLKLNKELLYFFL